VRDIQWPADVRPCQILYVGSVDPPVADEVIERVQDAPVLTVGTVDAFTSRGGVAHSFVQDGHMRVAINRAAAERGGLRISSRLLALARLVP
jgi:hypothetical protein